jgi:hypothetical protein
MSSRGCAETLDTSSFLTDSRLYGCRTILGSCIQNAGNCWLAHTRLSVVDNLRIPMFSHRGQQFLLRCYDNRWRLGRGHEGTPFKEWVSTTVVRMSDGSDSLYSSRNLTQNNWLLLLKHCQFWGLMSSPWRLLKIWIHEGVRGRKSWIWIIDTMESCERVSGIGINDSVMCG